MLQRALERDRKKRLRDIGIFLESREEAQLAGQQPAQRRAWLPWAVVAVLGVPLGAAVLRTPLPQHVPVRHFTLSLPDLPPISQRVRNIAVSPNGKFVAYIAAGKLWVRALDQQESRALEFTEGAEGPIWSPDSVYLAFHTRQSLHKFPCPAAVP